MNPRPSSAAEIHQEIRQLQSQFRTLYLATTSRAGIPNASYAPYVLLDGDFYILVSQLAKHTGNLLSRTSCHVLFVENEEAAANLFARRRLGCECSVKQIAREDKLADRVLEKFSESFGPVVAMLRSLPDFILFQLHPEQCNFVRGFGQAMQVDPSVLCDDA